MKQKIILLLSFFACILPMRAMEEDRSTAAYTQNLFDLIPDEIAAEIVHFLLLDDEHALQALKDNANLRLVCHRLTALLQDNHIQKRMYSLIYRHLRSCPTIDQQFLTALVKSGNTTLLNVCLVAFLERDKFSGTDVSQALIAAALYQKHDILKLLLKTGSNVNIQDQTGCTALMKAASLDDLAAVRILIEFGADANISDHNNKKAYDRSSRNLQHREIRDLLGDCEFYGTRLGNIVNKIKSNRFVAPVIFQQDDPAFERFVKQACYSILVAFLLILFIKQS